MNIHMAYDSRRPVVVVVVASSPISCFWRNNQNKEGLDRLTEMRILQLHASTSTNFNQIPLISSSHRNESLRLVSGAGADAYAFREIAKSRIRERRVRLRHSISCWS